MKFAAEARPIPLGTRVVIKLADVAFLDGEIHAEFAGVELGAIVLNKVVIPKDLVDSIVDFSVGDRDSHILGDTVPVDVDLDDIAKQRKKIVVDMRRTDNADEFEFHPL